MPIHLALIGTGRWGKNIQKTLDEIGGIELSISTNQAETADILVKANETNLDGVIVATPGSTHASIALPFIERGIPTLIEKPLTTDLTDAKTLSDAAQKHSTPVTVGHIHLYNPAFHKALQLLPTLGPIRVIESVGTNSGPFRDDMSAMWDWAPHDISMVFAILEKKAASVQAWGLNILRPHKNLPDTTFIKIMFDTIPVTIKSSWLYPIKQKQLTIIGETSALHYDDTNEQKLTLFQNMGPEITTDHITPKTPTISHPTYDTNTSPLKAELISFLALITNQTPTLTPIEQGLQVVSIISAAEQSINQAGKLISI